MFRLLLLLHHTVGLVPPQISLPQGILEGFTSKKVNVFMGVPYSKSERWELPNEQYPSWDGVKFATSPGNSCVDSEDCLYLNIYAPQACKSKTCSVFIWIHGGCFTSGAGAHFDFTNFASDFDIIAVTINYRLGILGTFNGVDYAIFDQRKALRWVRDNIKYFGSAIGETTLAGESAGAAYTTNHLSRPASWPSFDRAILESTGFGRWSAQPLDKAKEKTQQAFRFGNCTNVECMKKISFEEMVGIQAKVKSGCLSVSEFAPTIDGNDLSDHPINLLKQGKIKKANIIVGGNEDEGVVFIPEKWFANPPSIPQLDAYFDIQYGSLSLTIKKMYQEDWFTYNRANHAWTDNKMLCPALLTAQELSKHSNVYLYYFTRLMGLYAYHSEEVKFAYRFPLVANTSLAQKMSTCFANFVNDGDPACGWDKFKYGEGNFMNFGMSVFQGTDFRGKECRQLDGIPWEDYLCENPSPKWRSDCYGNRFRKNSTS